MSSNPDMLSLYQSDEFMGWLRAAILQSLFSDARALPREVQDPNPPGALRGFWADLVSPIKGDVQGSKLWLLKRRKQDEQTRKDAEEYASDGLAWLIEDGWAHEVSCEASWTRRGWLGLQIRLKFNTAYVYNEFYEINVEAL